MFKSFTWRNFWMIPDIAEMSQEIFNLISKLIRNDNVNNKKILFPLP